MPRYTITLGEQFRIECDPPEAVIDLWHAMHPMHPISRGAKIEKSKVKPKAGGLRLNQQRVVDALAHGVLSAEAIMAKHPDYVRVGSSLKKLVAAGIVRKNVDGDYSLASQNGAA